MGNGMENGETPIWKMFGRWEPQEFFGFLELLSRNLDDFQPIGSGDHAPEILCGVFTFPGTGKGLFYSDSIS